MTPLFAQSASPPNSHGVIYSDAFPGAEACAKIQNAVNAAIAAGGGVVDARGFQGAQVCKGGITIGADGQPVTLLLQPGSHLIIEAPLILENSSSIVGPAVVEPTGNGNSILPTIQAGRAMASVIQVGVERRVAAGSATLSGVRIDGHNLATYGIDDQAGDSLHLEGLVVVGAVSHGLYVEAKDACCGFIQDASFNGNGGDGIYALSGDWMADQLTVHDNSSNGIEFGSDYGAWRMVNVDIAQNGGWGVTGMSGGFLAFGQVAGNAGGINLSGNNQNTIMGLQFLGSSDPHRDGIYVNGRWNVIEGNMFQFGAANKFRYSINLDAGSGSNTVVGNNLLGLNNVHSGGGINNPNAAANILRANWTGNTRFPVVSVGHGVSWTSGLGEPTGHCSTGSLYSNALGKAGSTLYACVLGSWKDVN